MIRINNKLLIELYKNLYCKNEYHSCIEYDPSTRKYKQVNLKEGSYGTVTMSICQYISFHTHPITLPNHELSDYYVYKKFKLLPPSTGDFLHSLAALNEDWFLFFHLSKKQDETETIQRLLWDSIHRSMPIYFNGVVAPEGIYVIHPKPIVSATRLSEIDLAENILNETTILDDPVYEYTEALKIIYDNFLTGKYDNKSFRDLKKVSRIVNNSPVNYFTEVNNSPVNYFTEVNNSPVNYFTEVNNSPVNYFTEVNNSPVNYFREFLIAQVIFKYFVENNESIEIIDDIRVDELDKKQIKKFIEEIKLKQIPFISIPSEILTYGLVNGFYKMQSLIQLLSLKNINSRNFPNIWIDLMDLIEFDGTFLSSDDIINNGKSLLL